MDIESMELHYGDVDLANLLHHVAAAEHSVGGEGDEFNDGQHPNLDIISGDEDEGSSDPLSFFHHSNDGLNQWPPSPPQHLLTTQNPATFSQFDNTLLWVQNQHQLEHHQHDSLPHLETFGSQFSSQDQVVPGGEEDKMDLESFLKMAQPS
jgi:hypothetical protein